MTRALPVSSATPLASYRLFETTDVETARAIVAKKFCNHSLIPGASHHRLDVRHNHAHGLTLSLNYLRYGCDVSIDPGELTDFYLIQIPLRGGAQVRNGLRTVDVGQRIGSVLNPMRDTEMTWLGGCEKLLLQIDRAALTGCAERLLGQALPCPVLFDPEIRLDTPALQAWERKFLAALAAAEQGSAFGDHMHKHQLLYEEELITSFLLGQPSTVRHCLSEAPPSISSAQIRRARGFVLENLSESITVARIADAAGCSVRSLQLAFQQQFGCTPLRFLQRQRLNHAHLLLQSRPNGASVSDIAYESGFSHLGRFSIAYRKTFGQSPRDTLQSTRFS